jgi:hypothetical protein
MDPMTVLLWLAAFSFVCACHTIRDVGRQEHEGIAEKH